MPGWLRLCDITEEWLQACGGWQAIDCIEAWGWDARIVHELHKRGCPSHLLPNHEQLAHIRRLSSRQTAVGILPDLPGDFRSWWCNSMEEVDKLRQTIEQPLLLKAPWSCSGRGVFPYNEARLRKVLREQGGIEAEPLYDRVADFAMEFRCLGGDVEFLGLSAMLNPPGGAYGGNLVMTDADLLRLMTSYVDASDIQAVRQALIEAIRRHIAPHYTGPLGVDQMIVRLAPGRYVLHPCVEINLRHTMGHIAIEVRE